MPWPSASDYQDALQHPSFCFVDPALKAGIVTSNRLGPELMAGTFACVCRVTEGNNVWAVRCFLAEQNDRQERYKAIHSYLTSHSLPYFVQFEFLEQGIRVKGTWYPVLKMEWIQGTPLEAYLAVICSNPEKLQHLADQWLHMAVDLRSVNIAHGDLSGSNVLILPSGEIRLIDYDGMFVPALSGRTSNELGHPDYQHPKRSKVHYSASIDAFSEWVIYSSIFALMVAPDLWSTTGAGDNRLLFSRGDYVRPDMSPAFNALDSTSEESLEELGEFLKKLLRSELKDIPVLSEKDVQFLKVADENGLDIEEWLTNFLAIPGSECPGSAHPEWLLDYIEPDPQKETLDVHSGSWIARVGLLLTLSPLTLGAFNLGLLLLGVGLSVSAAMGLVGFLVTQFQAQPVVQKRNQVRKQMSDKRKMVNDSHRQVTQIEDRLRDLFNETKDGLARIRSEFDLAQSRYTKQIAEANDKFRKESQLIEVELANLEREQQQRVEQTLRKLQVEHVERYLSSVRLASAVIPGLGDEMKQRLIIQGVRTAADFVNVTSSYSGYSGYQQSVTLIELTGNRRVSVPGIGPTRGRALLQWRRGHEQRGKTSAPQALPVSQKDTMLNESAARRTSILQKKESLARANSTEIAGIKSTGRSLGKDRAKKEEAFRLEIEERRIGLVKRLSDLKSQHNRAMWDLDRGQKEVEQYKQVTFYKYCRRLLIKM